MSKKQALNIEDLVKNTNMPAPDFAEVPPSAVEYSPEDLQKIAAQELSKSPSGIFLLDLISRLDDSVSNLINDLAEMHKTMLLYEGIVAFLSKEYGKPFAKEYLGYGLQRVEQVFGKEQAELLRQQVVSDETKN